MKTFKIIILSALLVSISSCGEDVLDIEPTTKILADQVFENEDLARAYVTNLYSRLTLNDFNRSFSYLSDDDTRSDGQQGSLNGGNDPWDYTYLRDLNIFIENIQISPISEAVKHQLEGEVRFLRAYTYLELEMRYGGVPLVDVVLDPYSPVDEIYTKRSNEEAVADFIDTELIKAISLLGTDVVPQSRANKWTATALKARANLWAASIAKYGAVELNGLVGIPAPRAADFYTAASDAAKAVIQSEKYSLYNKIPEDRAENYRNIFVDEGNSEVIFEKEFDGVNIGHDFDVFVAPNSVAGRGGLINPTLEFLLSFENADGSSDAPKFGEDHLYDNGRGPFIKKDSRLFGMVFFQGDSWTGTTIQSYEATDPEIVPYSNPSGLLTSYLNVYQGRTEAGVESRNGIPAQESTNSGFLLKKYIDGSTTFIPDGMSQTNWIVIRLAEMHLIRAEAEFELGNPDVAVVSLNKTRERAGITLLDADQITLNKVRDERRHELAFEHHRYFDLRRWRIADSVLDHQFMGLQIIYHAPTEKYYFKEMFAETSSRNFDTKSYYNRIGQGRIDNNPDLVENPGY